MGVDLRKKVNLTKRAKIVRVSLHKATDPKVDLTKRTVVAVLAN